jgi:hypothetical protein
MLGVDNYIDKVIKRKVKTMNNKTFIIEKDYPECIKMINELIRLRHLKIHHEGHKGILGAKRLFSMLDSLFAFIFTADICILEKVPAEK